jgi:MFS family permease
MSNSDTSEDLNPPPGVAGGGPYAIFQNRDFTLYLMSRLVGITGQQMFIIAILWEIYALTHSALALGFVGLVQMVPMFLFTLPAGHVADNYDRKQIVVVTTAAIAVASLGVAFISWWHASVGWIYFCLFVGSTANTFMRAANSAFLPALVAREDFPRAVNWNAGAFQLSCILGRAAAGGLIAWMAFHYFNNLADPAAAAPVYVINAVASVVVCVLVGMIRRQHSVKTREAMTLQALLTGFKFVYASKIIFGLITLDMFAVFLGGATALLPIFAADILFVGPTGLGFLAAALPLGSILCVFILNHRPPLQKAGRTLLWAVVVFGLATIAFGFSKWFWFSFLMMFLCGAVDNISVVVRHTLVQMLTPDDKRGRVSAVNNLFIGTSNEFGEFESGTVAQIFGPAIGNTIVTGAIISAVSGGVGTILTVIAVALIWPEIRRYGKLA